MFIINRVTYFANSYSQEYNIVISNSYCRGYILVTTNSQFIYIFANSYRKEYIVTTNQYLL